MEVKLETIILINHIGDEIFQISEDVDFGEGSVGHFGERTL